MIPINLSIQGLYSYQESQHVNFQRLIGSNVFGIFGKVGSGKTSLLEAISFVLYGETERLNSRDNRLYNMMNLKSNQLKIDFEFRAGPEQHLYKFIYEAKRHPKKHSEIGPGERRMFIRQENDWHPIGTEKEDVAVLSKQILGLDYDNFKRTIIIPQNQFREFLELSSAERTKMMNQLFKLDQYDLADRVGKLTKANDGQLAELRGLLAPLEGVNPEAIEQAETAIINLTDALVQKDQAIDQLEPDEQRLLYAQKQTETLTAARQELDKLLLQETVYQQIRETITQYELCRLVFQSDLFSLIKLQDKEAGLARDEQNARQRLKTVADQLPGLRAEYEAAKQAYENRDQLQQQINELDAVQTIRTLQESVFRQTKNRADLTSMLDRKKADIDQKKAGRKQHQTTIDNLFGQESNQERLYKVKDWFTAYRPLKERSDDLQLQTEQYEEALNQTKQRKNKALAGFSPEWTDLTLKTLPDTIDSALLQLEQIETERAHTHQQAVLKQELQRYADALTDGQPCPLCGSIHHPQKHNTHTLGPDVAKSEKALQKVKDRIKEMTTLRLTVKGLETELRGIHDNGKRLIQERGQVVRKLTEHEDAFIWPEFSKERESEVAGAIENESNRLRKLQAAQLAVRDLNGQIEETEQVYKEHEKIIAEADTAIASLNGQIKSEVESLEHYRLDEVITWNLGQITDLRESLTQLHGQTKTTFDEADKQKCAAETDLATIEEQVQQIAKQQADLSREVCELNQTITKHLTEQGLIREQVEQILRSNVDVDAEKQRIRTYDETLSGLRRQIADLAIELAENPFEIAALTTIQDQLTALRAEKDALNKDLGKAGNVLATLEMQWQQKQAHQQRHDDLDLRRQDLKKMDELFRAQGFVNYVSAVYLNNLCESANERFFKLTNNQLKLELDDKNNFQVRDFLNGGEVRSVKTLSGGQMFQAALSLALALSDNIQHLTKAKQNLFFLDEGFGTLDKDALQTVFKTLKALRAENRVVGIISHVEELHHEVDLYIRTEASENGSRIVCSWDM